MKMKTRLTRILSFVMLFTLVLGAGMLFAANMLVARAEAGQGEKVIDLYVIAGQSNAAGYTSIPADTTFASNVDYYGIGGTGAGQISTSFDKVAYGKATGGSGYFGPEIGMATVIDQQRGGHEAVIYKYAIGGTSLHEISGQDTWADQLYQNWKLYLQRVVDHYTELGYTINLMGTYWMQGEADASSGLHTTRYADNLTALINNMRADYQQAGLQNAAAAPFVIGKIAENCPSPYTAEVRAAQDKVGAAMADKNVVAIETANANPEGDKGGDSWHIGTEDMLAVGKRVAETIIARNTLVMKSGASVRFTEPTGLRFTAGMSSVQYGEIVEDGAYKEGYSVGMLIAPQHYFEDFAAQSEVKDYREYFVHVKGKVIDLPFLPEQLRFNEASGTYDFNGAVVNVKTDNFDLAFQAVAYIAKTEDGVTTRTYSGISDARSIRTAAGAAVNSGKETEAHELTLIETYRLTVSEMAVTLPDDTQKTIRIAGEEPTLQMFADKIRTATGYKVLAFSDGTTEHELTETVSAGTVNMTPVFAPVPTARSLNVSFDTSYAYSTDASLVTAKVNGVPTEIEDGKLMAAIGDTVVFSHPDYMDVTVTAGEEETLQVSFVRAKATGSAGYDEENKTLTVYGAWNTANIMSPAGADFAVQLEIDPQNIASWVTYGIGIQADTFFSYGFSLRNASYSSSLYHWGFVSPSKRDWTGTGLFVFCGKDVTALAGQLGAKTIDRVTLTFVYHNDTHVLDAYINGILIVNYATGLTADATAASIIATDLNTTYLDWNYGIAGSGAYNGILESVGAHQWDNGVVTTEPTCSADGTLTYTCAVCGETRTESIPKTAHADEDGDGVCDICGEGVILYNFAFSFDTAVSYSADTSLVTVTRNGIAVTLEDGKYTAAPGDTFVFSHPSYMPVSVTTGAEADVTVSFVRATAATGNATYNEANKTLTVGGWQLSQILSPAGADFAVQLEIDPQNIQAWSTYGIGIHAGSEYFSYGFSRRNNDYVTGKYAWGFVSPSKSDWTGPGLFNLSAYTENLTELAEQLAAKTLDHVTVTLVYHNDTKVLDAYINGILVVNYATGLTGDATAVSILSTDVATTYRDWNYGLAGSAAYTSILASVGAGD